MGSPDVLMIEAADKEGNGQQAKWRNGAMEDIVDALPYIDHDYGDPKVKAEVDKLIAEEMRVSSKRPADFLAELPPAPVINLQVLFSPSFPPLYHMKFFTSGKQATQFFENTQAYITPISKNTLLWNAWPSRIKE